MKSINNWMALVLGTVIGFIVSSIIIKVTTDDQNSFSPPILTIDVHQKEYVTHTQFSESLTNLAQSMMLISQDARDEAYAWSSEDAESGDNNVWGYMEYLTRSMEEILDPASPYNQHMMLEAMEIVEMASAVKLIADDEDN